MLCIGVRKLKKECAKIGSQYYSNNGKYSIRHVNILFAGDTMMDLRIEIKKLPKRLQPKVLVSNLNAPIEIISQNLALRLKKGDLSYELTDGVVRFIWFPRAAVEFQGTYKGESLKIDKDEFTLLLLGFSEEIPIIITNLILCYSGWKVRGILKGCAVRSNGANAEKLVFHLVNFPDYIGQVIHAEKDNAIEAYTGRITLESEQWIGLIDSIPESKHLREEREKNGGFYISHVGEIRPKNGQYFDEAQLNSICSNLHYLLGFCCGSWAGPIFPLGIRKDEIVWEPLAAWQTGYVQEVPSWFPTRTPISELHLFSGFMDKINDPIFSSPLCNAISWYVEANKPEMSNEGRIVLTQVALEMLSWAYLVDFKHYYTTEKFYPFKAEKKIRKLLNEFKIPIVVPEYLSELRNISQKIFNKDAPGMLATTRNALVHSTEENRNIINKLNGIHLYQIAQMGIGFIELVILAICEYKGAFAQRGWSGWKGEDEIPVPWTKNH